MPLVERALIGSLRWLVLGLAPSPLLLLLPQVGPGDLLAVSTVHLSLLVLLGLFTTAALAPYVEGEWFAESRAGAGARRLGAAAAVVALSTGVVALVTLASSAALRYDPSLQFLQLLSALDIAWAAAALMIGARRLRGQLASWAAGLALGVFCVWSIWNYLRIVGFASDGGWQVDGASLLRYVLPADMLAAVVAVTVLVLSVRRHPTAQRSPQS